MTKCIGGKFNGEWLDGDKVDADRRVLMRKPDFPDISVFDAPDLSDAPMGEMTTMNVIRQWYTRRTVRCDGSEVAYYAPEEWSDMQAIRFALS